MFKIFFYKYSFIKLNSITFPLSVIKVFIGLKYWNYVNLLHHIFSLFVYNVYIKPFLIKVVSIQDRDACIVK